MKDLINKDIFLVENYKIFMSTFGIFEKNAHDVWLSWYLSSDPTPFVYVTIFTFLSLIIWIVIFKVGCVVLGTISLFKNNIIITILSAVLYFKSDYIFIGFSVLALCSGWFGVTIYYMLGYTL